jgi:26S proteasome regulatory subunit T5
MSTLEELDDLDRRDKDDKKKEGRDDKDKNKKDGDEDMKEAEEEDEEEEDILDDEILSLGTQDIQTRKRLLENDSRIMKSELSRLSHEKAAMGEKIKENVDKIANNRFVAIRFLVLRILTTILGNYLTWSATSLSCWTSIQPPSHPKKVPIST